MAADGDQPWGSGTRPSSLLRKLIDRVRAYAFLQALGIRRDRMQAASQHASSEGPEQNAMMRASEYLEICQENALDAYTVEDALYWHKEIITELSIELNLVQATRWPQTVKANMAATLEDRLNQHAAAVTRLTAVLENNKVLKWQP